MDAFGVEMEAFRGKWMHLGENGCILGELDA
jgi:hypothetical protein